jgi:hypothetical protein
MGMSMTQERGAGEAYDLAEIEFTVEEVLHYVGIENPTADDLICLAAATEREATPIAEGDAELALSVAAAMRQRAKMIRARRRRPLEAPVRAGGWRPGRLAL